VLEDAKAGASGHHQVGHHDVWKAVLGTHREELSAIARLKDIEAGSADDGREEMAVIGVIVRNHHQLRLSTSHVRSFRLMHDR
jgi:hypothetical protein